MYKRQALFNAWIFISPQGGTGGGCFRYMLSRYLHEAAGITGEPSLEKSADEFEGIGDQWEELGAWFREAAEVAEAETVLPECVPVLTYLADREENAWQGMRQLVQSE